MPITTYEAAQVFDKVESLGGTVPQELRDLVSLPERVRAVDDGGSGLLKRVIAAGGKGDDDLAAVVHGHAVSLAVAAAKQDLGRTLDVEIPAQIVEALRGPAGDDLFRSLQPVVQEHIDAIDRIAQTLPQDVTAEQVLQLGDEAADAWREGPKHAAALTSVLWNIVRPIAVDVIDYNPLYITNGIARFVTFMVDLSGNPDPDYVAGRYIDGRDARRERFQGWHTLRSVAAIRLNTPSEVQDYLGGVHDERSEREFLGRRVTPEEERRIRIAGGLGAGG